MRHVTTPRRSYMVGAAIVWAGILIATAIVLAGSPQMGVMISILGGGAVFFLIILPSGLFAPPQTSVRRGMESKERRSG